MKRLWWAAAAALIAAAGCNPPEVVDDGGTPQGDASVPPVDGGPECDQPNVCSVAGTSCNGDVLVVCAEDPATGCLLSTRTSCADSGEVCDDSGATPVCADPCADIPEADRCETLDARACNEMTLEVCTMDAAGCLVLERTECGAAEGGVCDTSGTMPVCATPPDPCDGLSNACTAVGTSCDGDELVTCAPNAFGCLVETRDDCASRADGICEGTPAACTFTGDACEGVEQCAAEGVACDGPDLVECAPDAFGCLVETRTTCTDAMFGFCDEAATVPACSTAATDPCLGATQCGTEPTRVCSADYGTVETCLPNAFGCLVAGTIPCASPEVCADETGTAVCAGPDQCPEREETILGCSSGTINGDTAMGVAVNSGEYGSCYDGTSYPGSEQIWRFRNDAAAPVEVEVVAVRGSSSSDFDLFVLEGGRSVSCSGEQVCIAASRGTSATETVRFEADPGDQAHIVYEIWSSTSATTDYALTITCRELGCGNGVLTSDEECDDGNTTDGDGCSASCEQESGYECTGDPSTCAFVCGNGMVQSSAGEQCDDGNTTPGDGCSANCQREPGYQCSGTPSTCTFVCGNGTVNSSAGEQCDDGNTTDGDGCSATCRVEPGFQCDGSLCVRIADNATCAGATAITATTTLTGEQLLGGGARPTGTGCSTGSNTDRTLYYAVTVPAGQYVNVQTTPSVDIVLFTQDSCAETACTHSTDSSPERTAFVNDGTADITRIVGIRPYDDDDRSGTVDIAFTYNSLPSNRDCAGATAITGTTTLVGEQLGAGAPPPSDSSCGGGSGNRALYYAVTIPAGQHVHVQTDPSVDIVLFTQDACGDTGCTFSTDSRPEQTSFLNDGTAEITRIVGIRPYSSSTTSGTVDIAFTYTPLPANRTCAGATAITGTTTIEDEQLALGGPRPSGSGCGSGTGERTLYYAVTIPAGQYVHVQTDPSVNIVLFTQDACTDTDCTSSTDSSPERTTLVNDGGAEITRIVGIRTSSSSTTSGTVDLTFTYTPLPANRTCANATAITATTTIEDEQLAGGGPRPSGSDCGNGTGDRTLYYSVSIPAGQSVHVETAPSVDIVLFTQDACTDTGCTSSTDSSPERTTLVNDGSAEITRIVGIRPYNSSTTSGAVDLTFTYSALAANSTCGGATPISTATSLTGQDTAVGGAAPTGTTCDTTGGPTLYYAVTVPAGDIATVEADGESGFDVVVMLLDSCAATDCSASRDSTGSGGVERITIDNSAGTEPITRIVAINEDDAVDTARFDLDVSYRTPATNKTCESATPVTADASFTAMTTEDGGASPSGSVCGSAGSSTLYWEVTIPAETRATVTVDSASDLDAVVKVMDDCSSDCSSRTDRTGGDGVETVTIDNADTSPVTRIIAVNDYWSTGGSFDLDITFAPIAP